MADQLVQINQPPVHVTGIAVVGVWNPLAQSHEGRGVAAVDPAAAPPADRWVLAVLKDGPEAFERLSAVVDPALIAMPDVLRLVLLRGPRDKR